MGVISVIAGIATVILLYCAIIITNLKGLQKGKKFLFLALIPLIICFICKTEDVEMTLRFIFGFAMVYPALISILSIFNLSDKENRTFAFVNLITLVLCIIVLSTAGMKWGSSSSSKKYYDKYGNSYYNEKDRDNADFLYDAYDAADEYRDKYR